MIIDSHAHVVLPVEKHIELMDEAGIDKTILFSTSMHPELAQNLEEYEKELNKLYDIILGKKNSMSTKINSIKGQYEIIKKYPSRFYGFGNVPAGFDYEKTASWVEEYVVNNNFKGIGEVTIGNGRVEDLNNIFKAAHEFSNLPIWIHAFWPLDLNDLKGIFNLAKQYSEVPVVIGHLGGLNWLDTIKMTKEVKNVYIDLSAFYAVIQLSMVIKELPDRCLFSTDLPFGDLAIEKFAIERVCTDETVIKQVMGENAARLVKLGI
ncbi:amidohydrolase family protein [Clostridium guangxiense]|uniref:amidohydrolase family protein n=1 Tax=Clostridium guangxiense TaxID=1662055 RepID=UPI001E4B0F14|nr:amidohydrolase family protein [Clostridium guangxiense]MCD2348860.1 amidohydrolase family protein [Clostridium guangxiense]